MGLVEELAEKLKGFKHDEGQNGRNAASDRDRAPHSVDAVGQPGNVAGGGGDIDSGDDGVPDDLTIPTFLLRGHPDNEWLVNAPEHYVIKPTGDLAERDERWREYKRQHAEQQAQKSRESIKKLKDQHQGQRYDRKQRRWVPDDAPDATGRVGGSSAVGEGEEPAPAGEADT